jgi:Raf kinase inhibitor-like YbhB/YbcL family protein
MKFNGGSLKASSSAFAHGERIPDVHSNNGTGISPPIAWSDVPEGTTSFAVVCHDPDAPLIDGFTHWVVYGIPGDARELPEGGGDAYTQGANGMGQPGWIPAAPPAGDGTHFYHFHVYAIGNNLELEPGLSLSELRAKIDPDVINQARVVGTYSNE